MTMGMSDSDELIAKNNAFMRDIEIGKKQEHPGFYAILPAYVRYNDKLTYFEKILYAELSALANERGYCYASNAYFADRFKCSVRTVSRALSRLDKLYFTFSVIEKVGDREYRMIWVERSDVKRPFPIGELDSEDVKDMYQKGYSREQVKKLVKEMEDYRLKHGLVTEDDIIDITPQKEDESQGGVDKNVQGGRQKCLSNTNSTASTKSTISTNSTKSTKNTIKSTVSTPPAEVANANLQLPSWLGRNAHTRLARIYELVWELAYNAPHKVNIKGFAGKIFRNLLKDYSEVEVGMMLILHFEWKGIKGTNNQIHERLYENGFPLGWIPKSAPLYSQFIKEHIGAETQEDMLQQVEDALEQIVDKLGFTLRNNE